MIHVLLNRQVVGAADVWCSCGDREKRGLRQNGKLRLFYTCDTAYPSGLRALLVLSLFSTQFCALHPASYCRCGACRCCWSTILLTSLPLYCAPPTWRPCTAPRVASSSSSASPSLGGFRSLCACPARRAPTRCLRASPRRRKIRLSQDRRCLMCVRRRTARARVEKEPSARRGTPACNFCVFRWFVCCRGRNDCYFQIFQILIITSNDNNL